MIKLDNEYHSCYDELVAYLFTGFENNLLKISEKLTAHEIIIYSILLHRCIEEQNEELIISYTEIQKLRNKRCGKMKALDDLTLQAYDKAFYGLSNKIVKYDLDDKRKKYKITYKQHQHPIIIVSDVKLEQNGNKIINCSLGPLGKTLIESKRYSTLVPKKYFQLNFNEITTYEISLYVCRIIYIERKKKKTNTTITFKSILSNINKYINCNNELISNLNYYNYNGPNKKKLYNNVISKTNELLDDLLKEDKISSYEYKNISDCTKWIINYSN